MSHAANLRNRHRPEQGQLPSKRRRTAADSSPKINGTHHLANGVLPSSKLSAILSRDVKAPTTAQPVESDAKIRPPTDEKDVETDDSEDDDDDDDDDDDAVDSDGSSDAQSVSDGEDGVDGGPQPVLTNGYHNNDDDAASERAAETHEEADEEEPSFADILRSRGQDPIDVEDLYAVGQAEDRALTAPPTSRVLSVPSANSLGTVLTQALKTNDVDLLESCFQVSNLESIRATIERLHSSHATSLLQKLAERLHKRPGRAGSLMVWVQWTVVAHGGFLAGQPAAMRELHTLYQVVRQRATGLQPLLALKGKLDMLEAQLQLRRNMQSHSKAGLGDEIDVTYVEGQEDGSEDDAAPRPRKLTGRGRRAGGRDGDPDSEAAIATDDSDAEDETAAGLPDGVDIDGVDDDDDDDDSDESEDDSALIDDEAEETDDDSAMLSDEVDYDDVDEELEGPDSSEEDEPAPKRSKKASRG